MPLKSTRSSPRRICFVTGTRAEFGLMQTVLKAIQADTRLQLQLIVTGMHLDRRHGRTIDDIRERDWHIDAVVDWPKQSRAISTGLAISQLTKVSKKLKPEIVLVVGDRVEAFAAATAAHLSDIPVAHVHGGDRALGQMDDSLRHAISKLAHIHFPATRQSAQRLKKMGEDPWRIHCTGSPGIDGIVKAAATRSQIRAAFPELRPQSFALVVLHPIDADESLEHRRAEMLSAALKSSSIEKIVVVYPNSDPGAAGIIRHWQSLHGDPRFIIRPDIPRPIFLGLFRDAAMLVGNSSSGIIEAASFHTPVIDVGPRQQGRERCKDVLNVPYRQSAIATAVRRIWNNAHPLRGKHSSLYAQPNTGKRIAEALRKLEITRRLLRKIISY